MADSHAKMTQATSQEVIISILAGLLAPLLAIFLVVQLVLSIQGGHKPDTTSEVAQKATAARIQPVATLVALDANAPKVEKSGQEVYEAACVACHGADGQGAIPQAAKFSADFIAQHPAQQYYQSVSAGKGIMPAHQDRLSAEERWAAVEFVRSCGYQSASK